MRDKQLNQILPSFPLVLNWRVGRPFPARSRNVVHDPNRTQCRCATQVRQEGSYMGCLTFALHTSPASATCVRLVSFTSETIFVLLGA